MNGTTTRRRRGGAFLLAALLAMAAACAMVTNPVTGERELTVMSTREEIRLGQQSAEAVRKQIGLVETAELTRRVDAIGARLAALSPRQDVQYHFAVADMPEPNAFALPGGWIYVSRGLLAITNSEAELANVMGHEVGHVAALHAAQRQTRSTWVGLGTLLGTAAAGLAGGGQAAASVAQLGQVVGAGLIASYSRDQEREADEVGQQLAARGGWDPAAMASFLRTLERWSRLQADGEKRMPTFLDSHPVTSERVADTRARAATLAVAGRPETMGSHAAFLGAIEGLMVGPDPAQGVLRDGVFLHPGFDLFMEVPRGWKAVNQPTALVAQAPGGEAVMILEAQGATGDPKRAAAAWLQEQAVEVLQSGGLRVGGWSAHRVRARGRTQDGQGVDLLVTWIAHPQLMLRLTGAAPSARYDGYAGTFQHVASSLRRLTASERRSITEQRLAVVTARDGETLAALSRRTDNVWSAEETAVVNALQTGDRLAAGMLVKIAVERPYAP